MFSNSDINELIDNGTVVDRDGSEIGKVKQIFLNDNTAEPTWVTVKAGFLGMKEIFIPLAGANVEGNSIRVPYDEATVKDAPTPDADGHLAPEQEDELYSYYGVNVTSSEDGGLTGDVRDHDRDVHDADVDRGVRDDLVRDENVRDDQFRDAAVTGGATGGVAGAARDRDVHDDHLRDGDVRDRDLHDGFGTDDIREERHHDGSVRDGRVHDGDIIEDRGHEHHRDDNYRDGELHDSEPVDDAIAGGVIDGDPHDDDSIRDRHDTEHVDPITAERIAQDDGERTGAGSPLTTEVLGDGNRRDHDHDDVAGYERGDGVSGVDIYGDQERLDHDDVEQGTPLNKDAHGDRGFDRDFDNRDGVRRDDGFVDDGFVDNDGVRRDEGFVDRSGEDRFGPDGVGHVNNRDGYQEADTIRDGEDSPLFTGEDQDYDPRRDDLGHDDLRDGDRRI